MKMTKFQKVKSTLMKKLTEPIEEVEEEKKLNKKQDTQENEYKHWSKKVFQRSL